MGAFWVDNDDANILRCVGRDGRGSRPVLAIQQLVGLAPSLGRGRSTDYFEALFARAGLRIRHSERQRDWPDNMFPLVTYVLTAE